ncbi:MAG: MaoC family dehydratase N-terminal domain-containing protein [Aquamicrobium sp.]|uniref:FAS1-like dehydratase domain-containing protein n=1 Tax=Aquamicrobium sp. TaxID=1872579 RepID=UPI00349EA698|nr:MaoC family dehydratase N-terminal domain-containing protein [Aquamicrobium sp.]
MTGALDLPHLKSWIGKTRSVTDTITPRLAASLAAILDEPAELAEGDPAPAGIHWCLSPDIAPMSGLGPDGHPARGGFLPPVPLPRRMWAGGRLRFHGNFRVGERIRRDSTIKDVEAKEGRSGALCFVTVAHEYHGEAGPVLGEEHDIVYREITPTVLPEPPAAPARGEIRAGIEATPVLLARYSAVTFNGHRIHYDRDYTRDVELYPGLIVHGPLQATYLLRMARDTFGAMPARFDFRGRSPLFDGQTFSLEARRDGDDRLALWAAAQNGVVTLEAEAWRRA